MSEATHLITVHFLSRNQRQKQRAVPPAATRRQSSTWDQIGPSESQQTNTETPHSQMNPTVVCHCSVNVCVLFVGDVPAAPPRSRCTPSPCRCSVRRCRRAAGGHRRSRCIPPGPRNSPCSSTKLRRKSRGVLFCTGFYCFFFFFFFFFVLSSAL